MEGVTLPLVLCCAQGMHLLKGHFAQSMGVAVLCSGSNVLSHLPQFFVLFPSICLEKKNASKSISETRLDEPRMRQDRLHPE